MKSLIAVALIILIAGCYSRNPEKTGLEGKALPSYDFLSVDSVTHVNTGNTVEGKPIVLFFFGPSCPYSHAQMQEIIEDIDNLKNIQFYILTISPFNQMKQFYTHYQLNKYPNIVIGLDYKNSFDEYFAVPGVPYTVIYGKDKKMRGAFVGKIYSRQIKEVAEK
ncbi:TlpA family protein disulfide reductase [Niastella sp. OAS944]|uniref:TlpA family protein disulfide reductase n=1 Tax=Niastella sp. OAS944 TaxID=2664089 RepID=UPI00348A16F7|nr:cytochrome oxidase Cu insertion factor (SCO1/SenC/PrrC family) [Chitinophagaceae bacterium OAS944]